MGYIKQYNFWSFYLLQSLLPFFSKLRNNTQKAGQSQGFFSLGILGNGWKIWLQNTFTCNFQNEVFQKTRYSKLLFGKVTHHSHREE